jgi:serine/threonine protein kinase
MESRLASARLAGGLDGVDRAVRLLEEEWRRHGDVQLERVWQDERRSLAADDKTSLTLLVALIKADLRRRFDLGQAPTVESYLARFPELRSIDDRVLSLVYEEFCLSEENGGTPDVESFCRRYPDWKSSLASQLQYHRLFSQAVGPSRPAPPSFPKAGENFEEFSLVSLLGKGGMSRVFLAADQSLGGKQVVLKVTLDRGQEPKVQGSLDHPHIVPLNSVTYQTGGDLCGLSMPFRRGSPLDEIIKRIAPASRPSKAIAIWKALVDHPGDAGTAPLGVGDPAVGPPSVPQGDGWAGFPVNGTYAQGVAWLVMVLARALHYAHTKRTFHRDVKPANILLTVLQGPQLLDFNLAESPHAVDQAQAALHGGTLPYMAPEQIQAFLNPGLWGHVGGQADMYSLGLVLRELLTGQMPELPESSLPPTRALQALLDRRPCLDIEVRRHNPAVPHGLAAIVGKCLALEPKDRYPDAKHLADDLEAFVKRKRLPHAVNSSRSERMSNWGVRHRRVLIGAACLLLICSIGPVSKWLRPPLEGLPDFQAAVKAIDEGKIDRAVNLLAALENARPGSSLVKFYLSMVLNKDKNDKQQRAADRYLSAALSAQDADTSLLTWARSHPDVLDYLLDFAEARIWKADFLAETFDDERVSDAQRDETLRDSIYGLASTALKFAAKLDDRSPTFQRLLATTEEVFGDFPEAYDRLCRLIDSDTADTPLEIETRFFCRRLRGRVAFLWAESVRHDNQRIDVAMLARLNEAISDFKSCLWTLTIHRFASDQELQEYHALRDKLRATITLAEVELDLSRRESAASHLKACSQMVDPLIRSIAALKAIGSNVPDATRLKRRLDDALERLHKPASGTIGSSPDPQPVSDPTTPKNTDQKVATVERGR